MKDNKLKNIIEKFEKIEKEIVKKQANFENLQEKIKEKEEKFEKDKKDLELYEKTSGYLRKVAVALREGTKDKIEGIVTEALNEIYYDEDLEFKMEFKEKRNKSNLDFLIDDGEKELSILNSSGGGLMNIVSTILRIIFVELSSKDNQVIILDEPASHLSNNYQSRFGKFISSLSERLGHQVIIVTQNELIANECHKMFSVSQNKKGITKVKND